MSGRLTPLRLLMVAADDHLGLDRLRFERHGLEPDPAVVDQQRRTGQDRLEDLRVRQRDRALAARLAPEDEAHALAGGDLELPSSNSADPDLGSLQVLQDGDRPAGLALEVARIAACTWRWSSWVPWLKFSRNTSAPARNSARIRSGDELAGPRVATILAWRWRRMEELLLRQAIESAAIRMARKSLTLVRVGPVTTRSPRASKKP